MEVLGEIGSVDLMSPEWGEYFVNIEPVLELWVELVRGSCDSNIAVEPDQSVGKIALCDFILLEHLVHSASLGLMEEVEYQLDEVASHVRIGRYVLFR